MAYWSSYDTTENSSSDVQWTVIVSYEAVHNSSRITGGFGAAIGKQKAHIAQRQRWKLSGFWVEHKITKQKQSQYVAETSGGNKNHSFVIFFFFLYSDKCN